MRILAAILGMIAFSGVSFSQPGTIGTLPVRAIRGEVVALYGTGETKLAHKPASVTAAYSFTSSGARIDYDADDFVMTENGLARVPGSTIYDFSTYVLPLNSNGKFTWVDQPRQPIEVHYKQVYVDYSAQAPTDTIIGLSSSAVTGRLLCAGDSITGGAHTVGDMYFRSMLASQLSGQITVERFSQDGSTLTGLVSALPSILANPPAAMTIAYGMNDHANGMSYLPTFKSQLTSVVSQLKAAGVKVILVGFPHKNKLWEYYSASAVTAYNDAIRQVASAANVGFVDIETAFEQARQVKTTIELFGDNYHHPNSYAHRLYFSGILPHLITGSMSEANVPNYLRLP